MSLNINVINGSINNPYTTERNKRRIISQGNLINGAILPVKPGPAAYFRCGIFAVSRQFRKGDCKGEICHARRDVSVGFFKSLNVYDVNFR